MRIAEAGQRARNSVTRLTTRKAAPALCRVASGRGTPQCTIATPMEICSATASTNRPPARATRRLAPRSRQNSRDPEAEQDRARHQSAQAMRKVNGDARRIRQHAAFVIHLKSVPQDEGVAEIHLRPPGMLAGGKVRAGHGGVIGAGPTAERDLQDQCRKADQGKFSQGGPRSVEGRCGGVSDNHHNMPRVVRPPNRCAVTIRGLSSRVTVKAPSAPCRHTMTNSIATGINGWSRSLRNNQRPHQQDRDGEHQGQPRNSGESFRGAPCAKPAGARHGRHWDKHGHSSPANPDTPSRHR